MLKIAPAVAVNSNCPISEVQDEAKEIARKYIETFYAYAGIISAGHTHAGYTCFQWTNLMWNALSRFGKSERHVNLNGNGKHFYVTWVTYDYPPGTVAHNWLRIAATPAIGQSGPNRENEVHYDPWIKSSPDAFSDSSDHEWDSFASWEKDGSLVGLNTWEGKNWSLYNNIGHSWYNKKTWYQEIKDLRGESY